MKYDYGKPEQGYSFEHYNFYHSLLHMGHDILYFDFMTLMQEHGREWMNQRLLEVVRKEKPDLMFTVLFREELDSKVVHEISGSSSTITLNWFCDDHWRFDNYSRYWAPCFNWIITTAQSALPKYAQLGYHNVIKSQWACNHFLYRKLDLSKEYDVTFIGQPHGNRRETIQALRDVGINVKVWGNGWESGRLSQEDMIRMFTQSRINLNLSNASMHILTNRSWKVNKTKRFLSNFLSVVPLGKKLKTIGKNGLCNIRKSSHIAKSVAQFNIGGYKYPDQIKGRNFEVPGCGGFLLTGLAEDLINYYEIGKEIVCFEDLDDLKDKIRYYLSHEDERATIAKTGYQRTLREHTYVHRFTEIFKQLELPYKPLNDVLKGNVDLGRIKEVL